MESSWRNYAWFRLCVSQRNFAGSWIKQEPIKLHIDQMRQNTRCAIGQFSQPNNVRNSFLISAEHTVLYHTRPNFVDCKLNEHFETFEKFRTKQFNCPRYVNGGLVCTRFYCFLYILRGLFHRILPLIGLHHAEICRTTHVTNCVRDANSSININSFGIIR